MKERKREMGKEVQKEGAEHQRQEQGWKKSRSPTYKETQRKSKPLGGGEADRRV